MEIKKVETEKNEKGASLVEYALLVALIVLVAVGGIRFLGTGISTQFSNIGSAVVGQSVTVN